MAGKTNRSGDWGKEEHIRVQLNIERQQFSQPTKEMANARPRGLRIWYKILTNDLANVTFSYLSQNYKDFNGSFLLISSPPIQP